MVLYRFFPFRAALALLLLMLAACAPKQAPHVSPPVEETAASDEKGAQIWQRFRTQAATAEVMSGPFRISGTLRYTDAKGENARVSSLLWGNGRAETPYPLRLDLLAGVGTVVAKAREDKGGFVAYVPEEKSAYIQEGDDGTLASFGVPVPLSLGDLALLLTGRCGTLFLPDSLHNDSGTPEYALTADGARFAIPDARLPGLLELSSTGAPLSWKEQGRDGWSIVMESGVANPLQPRRLRISHPNGLTALVVVKEIARVSPPYSAEQMSLLLPPGTDRKTLAQ